VRAATEIFAERGYRNGSTAEIASRAGISSAQVYYYFPTKDDLLHAVLDHRDRIADELAGPMPEESGDIAAAFLRIAANNESAPGFISLYMILAAESTFPDHAANDYFRARYRRLRDRFAAAFTQWDRDGMLAPGVTIEYAAASTLALWDGIQLQWLLEPEAIDVPAHLAAHLQALSCQRGQTGRSPLKGRH
jgi:AcrR family transcriptional regulator